MARDPGRPKQKYKKVDLPHLKIYEDTIQWFEKFAEQTGRSRSEIYQEALDYYKLNEIRKSRVISL